jgi:hypothetical protein
MDQHVGFGVGATNLVDLADPTAGVDPAPGIAVAQHQMRASFSLAPTDYVQVSWFQDRAFRDNATAISPSIPPLDDDSAVGYGFALGFSAPTSSPGLRIGIDTELAAWSCPYVSYTDSNVGPQDIEHGSDLVGTVAFGLTPSYRSGPWTGYAGVTFRNHPTMVEKVSSVGFPPDPDVKEGPLNVLGAAGVSFRQHNIEVILDVHQAATTDPVHYGPAIGLSVKLFAGSSTHRRDDGESHVATQQFGPPGGPALETVTMHREAAWQVTKQAASAARETPAACDRVRELGERVRALDAGFYATVFFRDPAILTCLMPAN